MTAKGGLARDRPLCSAGSFCSRPTVQGVRLAHASQLGPGFRRRGSRLRRGVGEVQIPGAQDDQVLAHTTTVGHDGPIGSEHSAQRSSYLRQRIAYQPDRQSTAAGAGTTNPYGHGGQRTIPSAFHKRLFRRAVAQRRQLLCRLGVRRSRAGEHAPDLEMCPCPQARLSRA